MHSNDIKSLDQIGLETGTDKNSTYHDYLHFYEQFFGHLKEESFILMEVGIYDGASIKMWEQYFKNAKIIAFDIVKKENIYRNTEIIICDASDPFNIATHLSKNRPLIFIEDGSHKYSEQISTFEEAFLWLLPGGYYVCEDIQTSYGKYRNEGYNDQDLDAITYFSQLAKLCTNNSRPEHVSLSSVSKRQIDISKKIDFIIFRKRCVLIKKI